VLTSHRIEAAWTTGTIVTVDGGIMA